MRPIVLLSLLVLAFAILGLAVGMRVGDTTTLLISGVALLCAFATWRAQAISTFLRILIAIFSTELILSGLAYLVVAAGYWPASLEEYQITESLPVTLGIFAVLIYAISHIPVVRKMMRITDGYFESPRIRPARIWPLPAFATRDRRLAAAMIVVLVVINQVQVGIAVRLSFFNRAWFNAIQEKNEPEFWQQLLYVFAPWAIVFIAVAILEYVIKSTLIIRWRHWLTGHYISRWLDGVTHYRMSLGGAEADNPDQRIAEDVNRFIDGGESGYGVYSYSILLISTVSSLVSFAIILWKLSDNFAIPGTDIILPGFLFWVALIYAAIGTIVTHLIGRPLVRLFFLRQRYEANFRFGLARIREYNEQIALLAGEATERSESMRRFGDIYANYLDIIERQKKLIAFQSFYGQISPIIPYVFAAPFYFSGKVELGTMTQTAGAFGSVGDGLNFFVTYYRSLAEFRSVLDRLTGFDEEVARAQDQLSPIARAPAPDNAVHISDLTLSAPDGRPIVRTPDLTLEPHRSVLLMGPSGSGKSTVFRALAGIWPFGAGRIAMPADARVMVLPQKPYIPSGDLRTAVAYPAPPETYSDDQVKAALTAARLGDFVDKLGEDDNWAQRLSGGEQQRLAIARALLARPDWLLLDEATASLDAENELALYRTLFAQLPQATIVSIAHHAGLKALHDRIVNLEKKEDGVFAPEVQTAPAP